MSQQKKLNVVIEVIKKLNALEFNDQFERWVNESVIAIKRVMPEEEALIQKLEDYNNAYVFLPDADYDPNELLWEYEHERTEARGILEGLVIHLQEIEPKSSSEMTVEKAINIVEEKIAKLYSIGSHDIFKSWKANVISALKKLNVDNDVITSFNSIQSFIPSGMGLDKMQEAKQTAKQMLQDVIEEFKTFGLNEKSSVEAFPTYVFHNNNHNNNDNHSNQSNNVSQEVNVKIELELKVIIESLKKDLSPTQISQLNEIQKSDSTTEEKKRNVIAVLGDKVLDFGVAVMSNPDVWKMFGWI